MDRFEQARQQIKERVDIVAMIGDYVPLTRRGRLLVACCPFHAEKTPSFTVYPESQHYMCFGCRKSGDVFSFLMEREGIAFREAFEQLAERAGVSLDGVFGSGERRAGPRVDYHGVLARVRDFYAQELLRPEGRPALDYLRSRGLEPAIESFGLGAHPRRAGALREFARANGLPMEVLAEVGLLSRDGRREPLFGRVIFPITDDRGRVVGFGGRVLPGDPGDGPKYWNTPESPIFNKRRVLFGLRQVKQASVRRIVVAEGYTDVIACHLAGLRGVVATLGTSLTIDHARLLERWATDGVVLLFDGDDAGRRAADRAFRELVHTSLPVRIALLPEGMDPADQVGIAPGTSPAVATAGREALASAIDEADDPLTVWFRLMRQRLDLTVDADVERAAVECTNVLREVENRARREALRAAMARHLGLSSDAIEVGPPRGRPRASADPAAPAGAPRAWTAVEQADLDYLACLLIEPGLAGEGGSAAVSGSPQVETLLGWVRDLASLAGEGRGSVTKALFTRCGENTALHRFIAEAADRATRIKDARSIFLTLQASRRKYFAREEAIKTRRALQEAMSSGDEDLANELTRRYVEQLRQAEAPVKTT